MLLIIGGHICLECPSLVALQVDWLEYQLDFFLNGI